MLTQSPYVDVSVNIARIDKSLSYLVPSELIGRLKPGHLVLVPLGNRIAQGVVLANLEKPDVEASAVKELIALLSDELVLTEQQLELAQWLSAATMAPIGACVGLMLPVGISQRADVLYSLNDLDLTDELKAGFSPIQKRIFNLLKTRGALRGAQITRALPKLDWRGAMLGLRKKGIVKTKNVLPPPRVTSKTVRTAALSIPVARVAEIDPISLGATDNTRTRRMAVLQLLATDPLPMDFSWIYAQTGANYADLTLLADEGLIHFKETEVWRDPLIDYDLPDTTIPNLTDDQQTVWDAVLPQLDDKRARPFLLHGVTSSGKTEIYMRAVQEVLAKGKQALVLVPEIAMTPLTVRRFMARFPNQVGIYHSKLSDGERYDTWRRAKRGDLNVIIGSRSALFMPLEKLGLIVIDECDNDSYDETERLPFYHAVETAEAYAKICDARLILGSATPRVTQYYKAEKGDWQLLRLPRRVPAHLEYKSALLEGVPRMPPVHIVDMRQELIAGNRKPLSRALQKALARTLDAGQQAILFLNRKGSATYVFCRNCGFVVRCPRDDAPLTFHRARRALVCHQCGYTRQMPKTCPSCGSKQIRQLGMGTERLEDFVKECFPQARVMRWDAESTREKGAHELILSHFSAHRADILIGTQMLAKGLDFPKVTLVGIILAELGLNFPDFRAGERVFQLLTQVAGRAGRSPLGGQVIMQSYQPENPIIQLAAQHDFDGFYRQELAYRRELNYPPFSRLTRLIVQDRNQTLAQSKAEELAIELKEKIAWMGLKRTTLIGPSSCYYEKMAGKFRWQIIVRGPNPNVILEDIPLREWLVIEPNPPDLL
ncbi:MAG TPA: primosomal protein N' [Anaerolineaceae bacterium]|nr:primosomal protein N' [Anaerolineaceae bacterium]HQC63519.1 primosomal protein N' [Anaerolineaceae bacterium]